MLAFLASAFAADWPMWKNNAGNNGISAETISLPLVERWHSTAPEVEENGAVVANGIAYMSTEDGMLYAFYVATGFTVSGFPVTTAANYGTPAVDVTNDRIYVLAGANLFAFHLNGSSAWTRSVGSVGTNYNEGPVIDAGFVYIQAGGTLQKYDANGNLQYNVGSVSASEQPAVMGDYVYCRNGGLIRKFSKSTGVEVIGTGFPISSGSSYVAVTAANGKLFNKADQLYAYNADNGNLLWSVACGGDATYGGSPTVANGVVYVYGYDGKMYAFDETTGATVTGFPSVALNAANDRNWGSPVVAGNKVFIGAGTTQRLKVLGAAGSAQAGLVLADYLTFSTDTQGFDLCSAVIADGWVFAMLDGGGLYAFYGGGGEPPAGALVINDGASCTESRLVTLDIDNTDGTQMRISEDPYFTGVAWQPFNSPVSFELSAGYGTKTVYAQLMNANGVLSNVFTDQIDYSASCGPTLCDVNDDGKIDRNDINLIFAVRGRAAQPGDPRDLDGNGLITVNDARGCALRCTKLNCAP